MDPLVLCLMNEVVLLSYSQGSWQCEFQNGAVSLTKAWVENLLIFMADKKSIKALKTKIAQLEPNVVFQHQTIMNTQWVLLCKPRSTNPLPDQLTIPVFTHLIGLLCEQRFQLDQLNNSYEIVGELNKLSCGAVLLNRASAVSIVNRQARLVMEQGLIAWEQNLHAMCLAIRQHDQLVLQTLAGRDIIVLPMRWHGSMSVWQLMLILPTSSTQKRSRYPNLTPSEVKLCNALCCEKSPSTYASESQKSIHTVRAQIQGVYRKFGVNRLSQLLQKLTCLPTDTAP